MKRIFDNYIGKNSVKKHPKISPILHIVIMYAIYFFLYAFTVQSNLDKMTMIIIVVLEGLINGLNPSIRGMVNNIDSAKKDNPVKLLIAVLVLLLNIFMLLALIVATIVLAFEVFIH